MNVFHIVFSLTGSLLQLIQDHHLFAFVCRACQQIQRSADGDEDSAHQKQVTPRLPSGPVGDLSTPAAVMKTISACFLFPFSSASKATADPRHSAKLPKPQEAPHGNTPHAARRQTHSSAWVAAWCWHCHNTCKQCFAWGGWVHCVVFLPSCTLSLSHRYVLSLTSLLPGARSGDREWRRLSGKEGWRSRLRIH